MEGEGGGIMNRRLIIGVSVLVGLAVIAYLATGQMSNKAVTASPRATTPVRQTETFASPASKTEEAAVVNVTGNEYSFTPSSVKLEVGKPVKMVYKNDGKLPHDLVLKDLGVRTNVIAGGKEETISFVPEKSGVFTYYCSVGNHRQLGMEGKVKVE